MLHPDEVVIPKWQKTKVVPRTREFEPDENVWVTGKPKWIAGKVIAKTMKLKHKDSNTCRPT